MTVAPPPAPLLPAPLVVTGHLVTFDEARPEIPSGALYIDRDGLIVAVADTADPPPPGFEQANRVDTDGVVYPGLIDLHNHIAYNCLSLWAAPGRSAPWTARSEWPQDPDYLPSITLPVNALCAAAGKAVLKYVETKAVVGGVTAIQGSSKVGRPFEGWMVRNVEYETFRTGVIRVRQAVFALEKEKEFRKVKRQLDAGDAFIYHLSEGTDPALRAEYEAMGAHGCIAPRFVGIHCTALGDPQFADWTPRGGSVVWSPFSNLWLYGATTDVAAARARGLRLCLGSDWAPSGTKSLLGELKVADLLQPLRARRAVLGSRPLPDGDLQSGRRAGMGGPDRASACRAVRRFHRRRSRGGRRLPQPRPGVGARRPARRDQRLSDVRRGVADDGGCRRFAGADLGGRAWSAWYRLRDERIEDADMSWAEVVGALEHVREDAVAAQSAAIERAGGVDELLQLVPDKPWDDPTLELAPPVDLAAATIGPLDSLVHDDAWFDAIDRAVIHGGRLSGLRGTGRAERSRPSAARPSHTHDTCAPRPHPRPRHLRPAGPPAAAAPAPRGPAPRPPRRTAPAAARATWTATRLRPWSASSSQCTGSPAISPKRSTVCSSNALRRPR